MGAQEKAQQIMDKIARADKKRKKAKKQEA